MVQCSFLTCCVNIVIGYVLVVIFVFQCCQSEYDPYCNSYETWVEIPRWLYTLVYVVLLGLYLLILRKYVNKKYIMDAKVLFWSIQFILTVGILCCFIFSYTNTVLE